jgi:KDO2-lipid IV(A) lauroyltransferase
VPELVGRTILELFSPEDLARQAKGAKVHGPGLAILQAAREAGRPAIVVSGHFGNYDVVRSNLIQRGFKVGGLYRRMNNPLFHDLYLKTIQTIGKPLFERGKQGMAGMVKFMKEGGTLAILIDQHMYRGERLSFFGQPAYTATSAAKLALKYKAPVIPVYAVRKDDGIGFDIYMEDEIPPGDPNEMTQALNDSLEARVRANMDQWLWTHRRWKGEHPDLSDEEEIL